MRGIHFYAINPLYPEIEKPAPLQILSFFLELKTKKKQANFFLAVSFDVLP